MDEEHGFSGTEGQSLVAVQTNVVVSKITAEKQVGRISGTVDQPQMLEDGEHEHDRHSVAAHFRSRWAVMQRTLYVGLRVSCECLGFDGVSDIEVEVFGQAGQSIEAGETCAASEKERAVGRIVVHELENGILKDLFQFGAQNQGIETRVPRDDLGEVFFNHTIFSF